MTKNTIVIVGKSPLDDKYGFNAISNMPFGSFIPAMVEGVYVDKLEIDASDGAVNLTVAGGVNSLGATVVLAVESGETVTLTGTAGVYVIGGIDTPNALVTADFVSKLDGVCNITLTYTV